LRSGAKTHPIAGNVTRKHQSTAWRCRGFGSPRVSLRVVARHRAGGMAWCRRCCGARRCADAPCAVRHHGFITAWVGTVPGPRWPPCVVAGGHLLSPSRCGGGVVLVVVLVRQFDVARFCVTSGHSPAQREVGGRVWCPRLVVVTARDRGCHGAGGVYAPIGRRVLLRGARHGGHSGPPFSSLWWRAVATLLVVVVHVHQLNIAHLCAMLGHSLVGRVTGGAASAPGSS
jgi:hypothetical protein